GPESGVSASSTSSKRSAAISTVCMRGSWRRAGGGAGEGVEVTGPGYRGRLDVSGCSAPHQAQRGVLEHGGDVAQQLRAERPVDEAVVEAQREGRDLPRLDPAIHHPRLLLDRADAEDRGLARVQDRGAGVDVEHAEVRDRDGAVAGVAQGG